MGVTSLTLTARLECLAVSGVMVKNCAESGKNEKNERIRQNKYIIFICVLIILCNFAAKIRIFFNVLIMERNFLEEEIPYEKMEKLGIGRTQLLKMPRDILEPLMNGRITPLIMTNYKAENGKVISMPMKLQLVRDESGTVNLMTYQVRKEMERGQVRLSNKEAEKLKEGGVLRKELRTDGIRKMKYIQLDRETNSLMIREAASIRISDRLRNVEKLKDIELGTNQKQAVMWATRK